MKVLVRYADNKEAKIYVSRLPHIGEVLEGQIVKDVQTYGRPIGDCEAIIILELSSFERSS